MPDRFILHDIIYEALGFKPNDDQIDSVIVGLPQSILNNADQWGFKDTEVRDSIFHFLTYDKEKTITILSKYSQSYLMIRQTPMHLSLIYKNGEKGQEFRITATQLAHIPNVSGFILHIMRPLELMQVSDSIKNEVIACVHGSHHDTPETRWKYRLREIINALLKKQIFTGSETK